MGARSPFRLRSHSVSSSARTCDDVPTFGSPQVCGQHGRIPPTLTRSSERLGHGFSPRFCRRAPKAWEASKGGARQAAPVGRYGRGMWVPGSQVSRPSGSLAAGMKSVRPCSRHRLAPRPLRPTHGACRTPCTFFPTAVEAQLPCLIRPPAALLQLLDTKRVVVENTRPVSLSPSHRREVCCAGGADVLCAVSRTTQPGFQESPYVCTPLSAASVDTTYTALNQRPPAPPKALSHTRTVSLSVPAGGVWGNGEFCPQLAARCWRC